MHNRKKPSGAPSEQENTARHEKCETYKALVNLIFTKRQQGLLNTDTLVLVGKLLKLNPDFYSLWNYRREILLHLYPSLEATSKDMTLKAELAEVRDVELDICTGGIKRNSKSYGAWHHRLWVIQRFQVDFDSELALTAQFLKLDQRNFHCWNYRRAVHELSGQTNAAEFAFSTEKLAENFSNYSAFHHRSKLLPQLEDDLRPMLDNEVELVQNAIFTEPDDQSAWWYLQFIIRHARSSSSPQIQSWLDTTLPQLVGVIEELLAVESQCRLAMKSVVFLIDVISTSPNLQNGVYSESLRNRRTELLTALMSIDSIHINRYRYLLDGHLVCQL